MLLKHEGEGAIAMSDADTSDADTMPVQEEEFEEVFEEARQHIIEAIKAQMSLEDTATKAKQSLEAPLLSLTRLLIKHEDLQVELQGVKNELASANKEIEKLRKRKACDVAGNDEEPDEKMQPVTPTSPWCAYPICRCTPVLIKNGCEASSVSETAAKQAIRLGIKYGR